MQRGSVLIPLTIFVAITILAAGSSWYFISKNRRVEPVKLQVSMPQVYRDDSHIAYSNPKLGMKLEIPKSQTVKEETEEEFHKRSNGDMRKNFNSTLFYEPAEFVTSMYVVEPNQDLKDAPLSIWVFENPNNLTAAAFYKKYWYYPFIWGDFTSAKEKIAPNVEFMIGESTASSSIVEYKPNSPRFTYLPKDGKMYLFKENQGSDLLKSVIFKD